MSGTAKSASVSYLQQHNLQKILEICVNKVVKLKPRDPFAFLAAEFAALALPPLPQVVFVLGGPAAGKSLHCATLAQDLGWTHLNTESLIADERMKGNATSALLETFLHNRQPVPADLLLQIMRSAIDTAIARGNSQFVVEGFPSSAANYETWKRVMGASMGTELELPFAILLDVPYSTLESRLMHRDTSLTAVDARQRVQAWVTEGGAPLLHALQPMLRTIDASAPFDDTYAVFRRQFAVITRVKPGMQIAPPRTPRLTPVHTPVRMLSSASRSPSAASCPDTPSARVVFVLGGPGSGRNSLCTRMSARFGFVAHLQSSALLRAERLKSNANSALIEQHIASGQPPPIDLTVRLIRQAVLDWRARGKHVIVMDDFPRNLASLSGWEMGASDIEVSFALALEAPESLMRDRCRMKRAMSEDGFNKKYAEHVQSTLPVVAHFRSLGSVVAVNAEPREEEVHEKVFSFFNAVDWYA